MSKGLLLGALAIVCCPLHTHNLNLFTDLLIWSAQQSGSEGWAQTFNTSSSNRDIFILAIPFGWDAGLRVGLDYKMHYDLWDTKVVYTWFRTTGKDQTSSTELVSSSFLGNFYVGNANGSANSGAQYHSGAIEWTILLNIFDWELGRNMSATPDLFFRPFMGLKGGWIHQTIRSQWENPISGSFTSARENLTNNFWGLGPSGGVNTKWRLGSAQRHTFSLFGDFSGAFLCGVWTLSDLYENNQPFQVPVKLPNISGASSMFKTFMGLQWDIAPKDKRGHFSMKLGYESQYWLDQLRLYSFNMGRLNNVLTLQGGSADLTVHF